MITGKSLLYLTPYDRTRGPVWTQNCVLLYERGLWVLCVLASRWGVCDERQQFMAWRVTKSV